MNTITFDSLTSLFSCSCGAREQDCFKVTTDHATLVCLSCLATVPWPPSPDDTVSHATPYPEPQP